MYMQTLFVLMVIFYGGLSDASTGETDISRGDALRDILSWIFGYRHTGRIVFSANLANRYTPEQNQPLNFTDVLVNKGGSYDPATAKFTCKVPGTYQFSWAIHKTTGTAVTNLRLMLNSDIAFEQHVYRERDNFAGSMVMNVQKGDTVWLTIIAPGADLYARKHSVWSGVLL